MKPLTDILIQYIKQHSKIAVLLYVVFNVMSATAQFSPYNLVPNPSFEQYSVCPSTIENARSDKPDFWYKPDLRGARYLNACANNNISGVPIFLGGGGGNFQYPRYGQAQMSMFFRNGMDARNYIQVKLLDSLRQGKCYYAEYYISSCNFYQLRCNNQAMLFTNTPVYVDTAATPPIYLLPANPQIQNQYIITDTLNWVKVGGIFTAQGGEQYLTLGNFKNNAQTQILQIQTIGYSGAAYFIDDVSVLPLDSITLKADAGLDKTINIGDSVFIGSFTTGLNNVNWYNSSGNIIANNVSGLFVKPTVSTFYVIEQTVCGQYSRDTVNVTVNTAVPLVIKNYELIIKNEGVVNKWITLNEINVSHFNIQRSSNGIEFNTIQQTTAKNNAYNEYSITDAQPLNGVSYYRIEAVDKDGKITYSKTEKVQIKIDKEQLTVFPNPATSVVNIAFKEMQQIIITDVTGRILLNKQLSGISNIQLNIGSISKGIFLVRVIGKDGRSETKKLLVQ